MTQEFVVLKCLLVQKKVTLTYENCQVMGKRPKEMLGVALYLSMYLVLVALGLAAAGRLSLIAATRDYSSL